MITIRKILCPIDLSGFSPAVLTHAMAFAHWYDATVTPFHVVPEWFPAGRLAAHAEWIGPLQEIRQAELKELEALVAPFALNLETAEGDAAREIVRRAEDMSADLIVMGTHGRSGFDRFALGSITEKVLRKASCPVLTLPPAPSGGTDALQYQHVLCATDFSESSQRALAFGIGLATRIHGEVTALHVIEPHLGYAVEDTQREDAKRHLKDLVAKAGAADVPVTSVVSVGKAHHEILRTATEQSVDVIVMGVHGGGPVDLTLFGSTANQVVRRATCPVMTLRAT